MTRTTRPAFSVILLSVLTGFSCSSNNSNNFINSRQKINGSGVVVQENRAVSGFTTVTFATEGSVTIVVGAVEGVEITTDDNLLTHLVTEVQGGELMIRADPPNAELEPTLLEFRITVLDLESFTLAGVADIEIANLTTARLGLTLAGVGGFDVSNLDVDELEIVHTGVGGFTVSGTADLLDIALSGVGDVDASNLLSFDVDVQHTGVGTVTVQVDDSGTLDVTINGSGLVQYRGNPTVTSNTTGGGRVEQIP